MYILMTKIFILSWQDIPTVIEARDYNGIEKVELSKRFSELIDLIAMKRVQQEQMITCKIGKKRNCQVQTRLQNKQFWKCQNILKVSMKKLNQMH